MTTTEARGPRTEDRFVLPALDILGGRVVRLSRGDFGMAREYGSVEAVLEKLSLPDGTLLHVVDLEGSRDGKPAAFDTILANWPLVRLLDGRKVLSG